MLSIVLLLTLFCVTAFPMLSTAQETEPPYDLPLVDSTATVTPTATSTTRSYATSTPTVSYYTTTTATVNEITAEDEAETGAEVYILAALSLVAGMGIFFIKKYYDIKRYSI
ncbi:MAG: hypothetical protein BWY43_00269 [candidate division WS2 bacterium ADurb.Bin280]|uniref:Gram-positive cocci surface proteins LPxTG domain-containing protein n=1 Tax=candidate division WS2 bacterium ADurb.Bin280 TaxID=1852829 RepID=A0A1V5SFK8_9BACT|nr:MAG: hypothetical protein BWY43_00269 [candidate division WS2 bacterium ADurb.Bin280]